MLISATGYTGSGGVEIYFEDKDNAGNTIWDAILMQALHKAFSRLASVQETRFVSKWATVYMATISMIRLHLLKAVWLDHQTK